MSGNRDIICVLIGTQRASVAAVPDTQDLRVSQGHVRQSNHFLR
jgi:hypothetical protein